MQPDGSMHVRLLGIGQCPVHRCLHLFPGGMDCSKRYMQAQRCLIFFCCDTVHEEAMHQNNGKIIIQYIATHAHCLE